MSASLDFTALQAIAGRARLAAHCAHCAALVCPGWESWPGSLDPKGFTPLGTLRPPEPREPHYREYHPDGTRYEAPDAPIAPGWHPYDQCDVIACPACERAFLRYTEYGGYYVDVRVRELDGALLVEAPLG